MDEDKEEINRAKQDVDVIADMTNGGAYSITFNQSKRTIHSLPDGYCVTEEAGKVVGKGLPLLDAVRIMQNPNKYP